MRKNVRTLVEIADRHLPLPEPIVEIGSYQVQGQAELADLRSIFAGRDFTGCDIRPGPGVDRIENVESLTFPHASVGSLIMIDTLEHIQNCHDSLAEAYRVLRPEGVIIATSVMDFAIHHHPSDYWRFTPEAFKHLFRCFEQTLVGYQGNPEKPHTVFAIGVKQSAVDCSVALAEIEQAYREANGTLYWRSAQVYYALRDLLANVRGWNNRMGFELITQPVVSPMRQARRAALPSELTMAHDPSEERLAA
ncbi:MAG: methyltransferase domain-containing protein [Dehalococcoidia bacterium]